MPILLTVAAIFRRLLLLQLSKTRVEVDDLVLEHQLRSSFEASFEVGARLHEPDIDVLSTHARPLLSQRRVGGADRDRTGDFRLAKPALSQLSYSPSVSQRTGRETSGAR